MEKRVKREVRVSERRVRAERIGRRKEREERRRVRSR